MEVFKAIQQTVAAISPVSLVSVLCAAALVIIVLGTVINFLRKNREERVEFIRGFKKGSCVIVYVAAIPLYLIGYLEKETEWVYAILKALQRSAGLIVLNYHYEDVESVMETFIEYRHTLYLFFIVVTLNAVMLALSLFLQRLWALFRRIGFNASCREKLLLVGNNEENRSLYRTRGKRRAMLVGTLTEKEKTDLYVEKMSYVDVADTHEEEIGALGVKLLKKTLKRKRRRSTIVINTGNDTKNIAICRKLLAVKDLYAARVDSKVAAECLAGVKVYVFGSPEYESVYNELEELSHGCLRFVNRHLQIATDFIHHYPLTQFMTEKQLDTERSLLNPDVKVNVLIVGFGKTGRQIFLTSVANNQFMTERDGKLCLAPVNYYVFDRGAPESNRNFNHGYARFGIEMAAEIEKQRTTPETSDYLPFPDKPANTVYDTLDVGAPAFYEKLKAILTENGSFNYLIVTVGGDLENIDLAQKLEEKRQEWGAENTYLFVKVREGARSFPLFERPDCFAIGDVRDTVYNMETLDNDAITNMAKMRNRIYGLEGTLTYMDAEKKKEAAARAAEAPTAEEEKKKLTRKEKRQQKKEAKQKKKAERMENIVENAYIEADKKWYVKRRGEKGRSRLERESNIYVAISLRSKLHMMGLDCVPVTAEGEALSETEYLAIYAGEDLPAYYEDMTAAGKPIVQYPLNFAEGRRTTMAMQEHYRWNSFMITKGFIPASKTQIMTAPKGGKSYDLRRHNNLTTFEGLLEFRRMMAERNNQTELETDVIKYDYQLLDDAYWILKENGYKIVRREAQK